MVYNSRYGFLFIHIQKNAGTAITKSLMQIEGSEFIAPAHLRFQDLTFKIPKPFIFTSIRNPWSRLVSWYEMMKRKGNHNAFSSYLLDSRDHQPSSTFSEYIRKTLIIHETVFSELGGIGVDSKQHIYWDSTRYQKSLAFNQIDYLTDVDQNFVCDMFLYFENLENDWKILLKRLNLNPKHSLLLENENPRPIDYRAYYENSVDIHWVENLYKRDIEKFGYSFASLKSSR
jgi:hypothetical protein